MSTRESFESWAASVGAVLSTQEDGSYTYASMRFALDAYQAATSRQEVKIKALVKALEELDEEWRELNTAEFGMQGEEANAFYSLPSTMTALAAAMETS